MFVEIDGLKINYTDEGSGYPLLLIHGWGSSILPWKPILTAFENYRLIMLDLPGCGESDILREDWGLKDYCDFILKFMKTLTVENPIMGGHSHGGRICLNMIGRGMVNPPKLILFDSAGIPAKKSFKKRLRILCFKTVKRVLTLPVINKFSASALEAARAHIGSADYRSAPEVMRKTMVRVIGEDMRPVMPNIKCPTLLIWGSNDTETPLSDAKQMEKLIPDCGLCPIEGTGHFPFIEKPYQVIAILKSFLS